MSMTQLPPRELTPEAEATLHVSEVGLQLALNAYQRARPEELRIVSANYPDGDPDITPISLNYDGEWLDYALRIEKIAIDMAPPDPALQSPIPPAVGQFQLAAEISIEFRNFADTNAIFGFPIRIWVRCTPHILDEGSPSETFIALRVDDLRIRGIGPDPLLDYVEHIMKLVVRHALSRMRLPTTFNVKDFLEFVVIDSNVKDDTVQVYGAIQRPSHP